MNRRLASLLTVLLVSVSSVAFAQETPPPPPPLESSGGGSGSWSLYSGHTMGSGNGLGAEVGWPGLNLNFLHAMNSGFDLGARFTFNYGSEIGFGIQPAIGLQVLLKFGLLDRGIFSMALQAEPGIGFFFTGGGGMAILIPFALQCGIHPVRALSILLGVELRPTIGISFGGGGVGFGMPMLFLNPGVEYALSENLLLTFRMAFGPGIVAGAGGGGVGFSFRALMGVAFKF